MTGGPADVNSAPDGGRSVLRPVGVATILTIVECACLVTGCGASTSKKASSPAAVLHDEVVKALVGQPQNGPWVSTTVRKLRLGAIVVPHGNPDYASTITSRANATATITAQSQGPGTGQRLIPRSGATVTANGSVTATVAQFAKKWVVQTAQFKFPPPPEGVRHDPAIHRIVAAALETLFTYHGDPARYNRAQLPFYATSGSNGGVLGAFSASGSSPPALTTIPGGGGSLGGEIMSGLFSQSCPSKNALLVLPATMTLSQIRISPRFKLVSNLPTVLEVDASVAVTGQGWTADQPGSGAVIRCGNAIATIRLKVAVAKSMITGRWLIGQIADKSRVCCSSGFGDMYEGIDALS
jgi:hypothetical protein